MLRKNMASCLRATPGGRIAHDITPGAAYPRNRGDATSRRAGGAPDAGADLSIRGKGGGVGDHNVFAGVLSAIEGVVGPLEQVGAAADVLDRDRGDRLLGLG